MSLLDDALIYYFEWRLANLSSYAYELETIDEES